MNKFLFRLAFAVTVLFPASSVLAADLDVPPPVEDLRPATFDWTGPYLGIFGVAVAVDGDYDATCTAAVPPCAAPTYINIEHSGIGYAFGVLGGINYQFDDIVLGPLGRLGPWRHRCNQ